MHILNVIHQKIRNHCHQTNVAYSDCYGFMLSELDAKYHQHLDLYLDFLQDLGLIIYDSQRKIISLTEAGRDTVRLSE